jgi:outer membrane protein OmpU
MNNNNKKETIMNNLKKVGLSALAGSLAVVSANATEYTVTGDSHLVWSSQEGNEASASASNGKGIGMDTDLYFNASGELDNGWTMSFFQAIDMDGSGNNSSAQGTLGMGSLGTVVFADVGGTGANAIDDVLPFAYEETWHGTTHARAFDSFGSSTTSGAIDYRTPAFSIGDISLSATYAYDPNAGVAAPSTGGVGTGDSGTAWSVKASGMGLTVGGGIEEINGGLQATGSTELSRATGYIKYSNGPLTIGYQEMFNNTAVASAGNAVQDVEGDGFGIAMAQDNYSISYAEVTEKNKNVGATTSLETEMTALQGTYTMGAMTIGLSMYETDNPEGATGKYEDTELSLNFAF